MPEWSRYADDADASCPFCFLELTEHDMDQRKCPRCGETVRRRRKR